MLAADAADDDAVLSMIVEASGDPGICSATYLPAGMDAAAASAWLVSLPGPAWVLLEDRVPVGWWSISSVSDDCGVPLPAGTYEFETGLLPEFRGLCIST